MRISYWRTKMQNIPVIWDLIKQFKRQCKLMGWWASLYEDIVYADGEYHNFFCAKKVYPKTFRVISLSSLYPVRENDMIYRLVSVSYVAWILQEKPPEDIFKMLDEDQRMRRRVAVYDLSEAYSEKPVCIRLNETNSVVFREFERFLKEEYNINLVNKLLFPKVGRT